MDVACKLKQIAGWPRPRIVAAGFFDGVHRGHQELLKRTVERARERAGVSVVLTFDPHPLTVTRPERAPLMLGTIGQKLRLIEAVGVDYLLKLPFDRWLSHLSPQAFVKQVLVQALAAETMIVGFNFTFGCGAKGTVRILEELLVDHGADIEVVTPVEDNGVAISSTVIRQCLLDGDVERARRLLGRPYSLTGQVRFGYGRGRTIGFPTCNMELPGMLVIPAPGVYAVSALLPDNKRVMAVCNIGCRPTFGGTEVGIEIHLIDYQGDHYGDALTVEFHLRLRGEQRFASAQELGVQIARDIEQTREYFSTFACSSGV